MLKNRTAVQKGQRTTRSEVPASGILDSLRLVVSESIPNKEVKGTRKRR
jgi:hypothetical protein